MTTIKHRASVVSAGNTRLRAYASCRVKRSIIVAALLSLLTPRVYGASVTKPDVKLNPDPRIRYEITATVIGAPGGFESVGGSVDYKVTNPASVPLTPVSDATVEPQKRLPVVFERVADGVYKGVVYIDQIQDEDYFGLGVCHWSIVGTSVEFHHDQVNFSPAIYLDDILNETNFVRYFSMKSYENSGHARINIGAPSRSAYDEPSRTFTITLKALSTNSSKQSNAAAPNTPALTEVRKQQPDPSQGPSSRACHDYHSGFSMPNLRHIHHSKGQTLMKDHDHSGVAW